MYNFSQEQIFIFFFLIGIAIGIILDLFRVIRKCFKTPDSITLLEDLIFLVLSGYTIISAIIKLNGGEIRLFLFLAIFFGILIYLLTISNLCGIILYVFVIFCKKILEIPFWCLKKIQKYTNNRIKKDF